MAPKQNTIVRRSRFHKDHIAERQVRRAGFAVIHDLYTPPFTDAGRADLAVIVVGEYSIDWL